MTYMKKKEQKAGKRGMVYLLMLTMLATIMTGCGSKSYSLDEEKLANTLLDNVKFDCNMYIHPTQARGLTPREAARVQSYPDDYFFRGAYTKTYMQIGNSVPPLLGRAIASIVKKYL